MCRRDLNRLEMTLQCILAGGSALQSVAAPTSEARHATQMHSADPRSQTLVLMEEVLNIKELMGGLTAKLDALGEAGRESGTQPPSGFGTHATQTSAHLQSFRANALRSHSSHVDMAFTTPLTTRLKQSNGGGGSFFTNATELKHGEKEGALLGHDASPPPSHPHGSSVLPSPVMGTSAHPGGISTNSLKQRLGDAGSRVDAKQAESTQDSYVSVNASGKLNSSSLPPGDKSSAVATYAPPPTSDSESDRDNQHLTRLALD